MTIITKYKNNIENGYTVIESEPQNKIFNTTLHFKNLEFIHSQGGSTT